MKKKVSPQVARVLESFVLKDGKVSLPAEKARTLRTELATITGAKRNEVASELLVVATRFIRQKDTNLAAPIARLLTMVNDLMQQRTGWAKQTKKK